MLAGQILRFTLLQFPASSDYRIILLGNRS
jgi:hypothetical protein